MNTEPVGLDAVLMTEAMYMDRLEREINSLKLVITSIKSWGFVAAARNCEEALKDMEGDLRMFRREENQEYKNLVLKRRNEARCR